MFLAVWLQRFALSGLPGRILAWFKYLETTLQETPKRFILLRNLIY